MSEQDSSMYRRVRNTCFFCGSQFFSIRPDAKYCSAKCRQRSARWRVKLTHLRERLKHDVTEVAEYMEHTSCKPAAAAHLRNTIRQIEAELVMHGIMEVK
jgi:hypothetical protein